MQKFAAALLVVTGVTLGMPEPSEACSCLSTLDMTDEQLKDYLRKSVDRAFAVFIGEVEGADDFRATLAVHEIWKGDIGPRISVATGTIAGQDGRIAALSSCDYRFTRRVTYLVFADGGSLQNPIAGKCTTLPVKDAQRTIRLLREIRPSYPPKPAPIHH